MRTTHITGRRELAPFLGHADTAAPVHVMVMPLSEAEMRAKFDALPPSIPDVIDAAMALFGACQSNPEDVTIQSLADGFSLAMADGHDMAELYLAMLANAVRLSKQVVEA